MRLWLALFRISVQDSIQNRVGSAIWFLYEVLLLKQGTFQTLTGNYGVLAFSLVCLFFTLWHAITFLNLSGLILRVPIGDTFAPAVAIKALAFGGLLFVTVVGGAVMVYLGYVSL